VVKVLVNVHQDIVVVNTVIAVKQMITVTEVAKVNMENVKIKI